MSKIVNIIPAQYFELIRDRIGEILIDEIGNQHVLTTDPVLDINIYIERAKPFDKTELPAINIKLSTGDYSGKNQGNADGNYKYHIEVYTNAKTTDELEGDSRAKVALHKIMGVCRAILENPVYKTLGFIPPSISHTIVQRFDIAEPNDPDALNTAMGRLEFEVRVVESTELKTPTLIAGYETTVKIGEGDQGYYYEG